MPRCEKCGVFYRKHGAEKHKGECKPYQEDCRKTVIDLSRFLAKKEGDEKHDKRNNN